METAEKLTKANMTANPDFANFAHVFVPYCSGGLWSGQAQEAISTFAD